jgi:hypothetical protein
MVVYDVRAVGYGQLVTARRVAVCCGGLRGGAAVSLNS